MHLILRFIVNAIALYLIAKYVPGFNHNASFGTALIAALIFGIVNALLGPILRFVTFPLTVVTLGLFSIVVNYVLFAIAVWLAPGFHNTGEISPWLANLYGAVIMMLVSTLMQSATRRPEEARS
ncbi:MAG: phage holin family protein [Candidatus Eremiobacteraeota bacterium]|nr:phage holin family protein [Candidatus Eremiobacteraeota bacterium]MBV8433987.1 phage holin family protein [Candidatus Eremiobacteraeota bacterium]